MTATTETLDSLARGLRDATDARLAGHIGRETHAAIVAQLTARAEAAGYNWDQLVTATETI